MSNYKTLAKEIWARPYARRLTPDEGGGYTAAVQEFPGCFADGESAEVALARLDAAALSWIEAQLSLQQPVPEPIEFDSYSGRIALRIPRGLHKQAAELAALEASSLNQLLTTAITSYVTQKLLVRAVKQEFQKFKEVVQQIGFMSMRAHQMINTHGQPKSFIVGDFTQHDSTAKPKIPDFSIPQIMHIEKKERVHG